MNKAKVTPTTEWLYATIGNAEHRSDLVTDNLRLAWLVAQEFAYLDIPFEDLYQTAAEALCLAARQYDPARGKFSSYAAICIRRQIIKEAGQYAGSGRLPSDAYLDQKRLRMAADRFRKHFEYEPDSEELSAFSGISTERIAELGTLLSHRESLDEPVYDDSDSITKGGLILQDRCTENELDRSSFRSDIELALRRFPQRDADIFRHLYGIGTEEKGTAEVAMLYGLSRARINQISAHICSELRSLPSIRQYASLAA